MNLASLGLPNQLLTISSEFRAPGCNTFIKFVLNVLPPFSRNMDGLFSGKFTAIIGEACIVLS